MSVAGTLDFRKRLVLASAPALKLAEAGLDVVDNSCRICMEEVCLRNWARSDSVILGASCNWSVHSKFRNFESATEEPLYRIRGGISREAEVMWLESLYYSHTNTLSIDIAYCEIAVIRWRLTGLNTVDIHVWISKPHHRRLLLHTLHTVESWCLPSFTDLKMKCLLHPSQRPLNKEIISSDQKWKKEETIS